MARFGMGGGRARGEEAVPGPDVVVPRRSLDGWTLEGTALGARFAGEELRELGTLMHGVSAGMDTPWTYERAADILEAGGERPQALAVLDAYFALPRRIHDANPVPTRALARRRQRLRKRLGVPGPAAVDARANDEAAVPPSRAGEVQALADLDMAAFARVDAERSDGASKAGSASAAASEEATGAGASAGSPRPTAGPSAARRGLAAAKRKSKTAARIIAAKAASAGQSAGTNGGPANTPAAGNVPPQLPAAPAVIPPRPESPPASVESTAPISRKPESAATDIPLPPKPATPPPADGPAEPDTTETP